MSRTAIFGSMMGTLQLYAQHKQHFINENAIDHLQSALTVKSFTSFINAYTIEFKSEAVIFNWKQSENLWPMHVGSQQMVQQVLGTKAETKWMNGLVLILLFSVFWEVRTCRSFDFSPIEKLFIYTHPLLEKIVFLLELAETFFLYKNYYYISHI